MEYKEAEIAGTAWHRFSRVTIENPYMQTPTVMCAEQEIIDMPGRQFVRDADGLLFNFDPNESFPLIDPTTNVPIPGQVSSGMQVYVLIYSYVLHEAAKRDAAKLVAG